MTATATAPKLGFAADEMTAADVHQLLHAESADRSEVAGEHGIYLDDELCRAGQTDVLTVVWTFKGSVLLRHRPSGRMFITLNELVAAAGWEA